MYKARQIGALLGSLVVLPLVGCEAQHPPLFSLSQPVQVDDSDPAHARQLIADYGCVACHTVPGVRGPATVVGPPLEQLAMRGYIGGVLPNTPDNLVKWLLDPPAVDPLTAMPDTGLNRKDARDIAAYLLGLD